MVEQNFANHVRWVPGFHFFLMPVMALNFGWSIYRLKVANFSLDAFVGVLVAAALVALALYARLFAIAVQNRVIRLEETHAPRAVVARGFESPHRRVHLRPTGGHALRM